jgi:uncharacterized protein YqfA (UPF0365 family)
MSLANPRLLTRSLFAVALMGVWHSSISVSNAQVEAPGITAPAPDITEKKLDAAAAALQRVAMLQQAYRQRLAETPADKERIVAEASNAMTKAVADQGLSVEEYSSIMEVAQNDPEVRGKILQRIRPSEKERN